MFGGFLLGTVSSQRRTETTPGELIALDFNNSVVGTGNYQHTYSVGNWPFLNAPKVGMYNDDFSATTTTGAYVEFKFTGVKVEWWSEYFSSHGISQITLDGVNVALVDQYGPNEQLNQKLYESPILTNGPHTIRITVTGNKNPLNTSVNNYLVHDRFRVYVTEDEIPTPEPGEYNFYVSVTGNDSNPGTISQPFRTIQKAAEVAIAGQTVAVREGVYRESITPTNSGTSGNTIKFIQYPGETALISGLEVIPNTGWTVHSGNIYKKTITLPVNGFAPGGITSNTTILANQIFRNGEMMIQARWPKGIKNQNDLWKMDATGVVNTSGWRHYSNFRTSPPMTTWDTVPFKPTWLEDDLLQSAFTNGSLVGATIVVQGWYIVSTSTVNVHNGKRLQWPTAMWGDTQNDLQFRRYYYLTNQLQFLTQEREFHYEGNTLYYYQPGGGTPTGTIEYKARNWGFNLQNRSWIEIKGLNFIGCEVANGNTSTSNITVDNIRVSFANHNVAHNVSAWQGHGVMKETGLKLIGLNNTVKNSEFQWCASQGVWLGNNGVAQNNLFHHISYSGMWGCPVAFWGNDGINNIKVLNNTAYTLGRGFVDNGTTRSDSGGGGVIVNSRNHEVAYNNVYDFTKLNHDGGAWYSAGFCNISGLKIHHNWFHDTTSFRPPNGTLTDGIMAAIYFDMGSGAAQGETPVFVHHNLFWNLGNPGGMASTEFSDVYSLPQFQASTKQGVRYYNNVFWGGTKSYTTYQTPVKEPFRNCIFRLGITHNWVNHPTTDIQNCISNIAQHGMTAQNPLFVGGSLDTPENYFQLQSGSPARNNGANLPGYNDEDTSPKDIGAYYYGQTPWVPGYVPVPYTG